MRWAVDWICNPEIKSTQQKFGQFIQIATVTAAHNYVRAYATHFFLLSCQKCEKSWSKSHSLYLTLINRVDYFSPCIEWFLSPMFVFRCCYEWEKCKIFSFVALSQQIDFYVRSFIAGMGRMQHTSADIWYFIFFIWFTNTNRQGKNTIQKTISNEKLIKSKSQFKNISNVLMCGNSGSSGTKRECKSIIILTMLI